MFRYSLISLFLVLFLFSSNLTATEAYDSNGTITIKWDVLTWTPDGYVGIVTIYNFQKHRSIRAPGWKVGWTWARKEVIWSMIGAQVTNQGDCSKLKGNVPHSCKKNPAIIDLKPGTPYNQQIEDCCRGGVLDSWSGKDDGRRSKSAFQIAVGVSGTTNKTVKMPKMFIFKAPGGGYSCGPAKIVRPTRFYTADRRRVTQAIMTWNVTCLYSTARKLSPAQVVY